MPQNGSIPIVIYTVIFFHIYFHFSVQNRFAIPIQGISYKLLQLVPAF